MKQDFFIGFLLNEDGLDQRSFSFAVAGVVESLIEVGGFNSNTGLEGLMQYCNCSAGNRCLGGHLERHYFSISGQVLLAVVGWLSMIRTVGQCDTAEQLRH